MSKAKAEPSVGGAIGLRPMTSDDVAEAAPLLAQLGYEMTKDELAQRLGEVLSTPDHYVLIAEIDRTLAGLLHVFVRPAIENPREAVVQSLVTAERHRRGGVGRRLMAAAEQWGQERGCRSVMLSSNVVRAPAHAFYAALGYRISATSHIMRKPL